MRAATRSAAVRVSAPLDVMGSLPNGGDGAAGSVERSGIEPGPRARGDACHDDRFKLRPNGCSFAPTAINLAIHVQMGKSHDGSMVCAIRDGFTGNRLCRSSVTGTG